MNGSSSTVVLSPEYILESLRALKNTDVWAQPLQLLMKAETHCLGGPLIS